MPTLPMMTPTPHADASRKITAPGGYESWRFDASSDDGKLHLVAALHVGDPFDARYLRRYLRYRRRPTRVAPPQPADFCAVTFALVEKGRPALRFTSAARATPDDFYAGEDGRTVRLGASHLNRGGDGAVRLHVRGTYHDRTISANLAFRPQIEANTEVALAAEPLSAQVGEHGWVVVNPLCDVDGEISVIAAEAGGPPRVSPFAGVGAHDHSYGTRPMLELSPRWLTGRALFEDRAITFQQVGETSFVCRSFADREVAPRVTRNGGLQIADSGTSRWGISYPSKAELPGDVRLLRPRVVASKFASVTVAYDAVGELETGRALVQVFKPRRLLWRWW